MNSLVKVEGVITKFKVEDSKILHTDNLEKQAANTALVGVVTGSTSLMSNASLMKLASKGVDAKTFTAEINGIPIIGQFTTIKFIEGAYLVVVIDEEDEQGRHLVYAILDPKDGLLYMLYEMGRSEKKYFFNLLKLSVFWTIFFSIFL